MLKNHRNKVICGNVVEELKKLPADSIHLSVCSPPYWSLRNYGIPPSKWTNPPWVGCLGEEPTPKMFIGHLTEVFREVRRVLRPDGVMFLNIGDSYASYKDGKYVPQTIHEDNQRDMPTSGSPTRNKDAFKGTGIKNKDMVLIPFETAIALRNDGWWVRSDIIWSKKNCLPSSVKDRPATSHEYIFLLAKSERYFYDWYAVREPVTGTAHPRGNGVHPKAAEHGSGIRANESFSKAVSGLVEYRNMRSVWELTTEPSSFKHFATYPSALVARAIMAGSSEKGCCPECGAPLKRIVEPSKEYAKHLGKGYHDHSDDETQGMQQQKQDGVRKVNSEFVDRGWEPTCDHKFKQPNKTIVLDPFMGSGTTGLVAVKAGRDFVGIEINREYARMAQERIDTELNQSRLF